MDRRVGRWMIAVVAAAACAVGETEDEGVTFATYPTMTSPAVTGDTGDEGSSSEAGTASTQGDGASSGAIGGSSEAGSDAGESSGDGPLPATDTGPETGMQPGDGMYSDCLTAARCVGLNTCITILDTEMMPIDGFCTNNACTTPATDCDPTPGGTAVPFCMAVTLGGNADTACALDCSGGKTCPGGMTCWELDRTSVCS